MKVVAIIQARMGSTRLPGKVLRDIAGQTMLARVIQRSRQASSIDGLVVATTKVQADDVIVTECERLGVPVFRGSEEDVLDRYYEVAKDSGAEAVVRITSDCPLIDAVVVDRVVVAFLNAKVDYASNSLVRTYPRGLDTEVIVTTALAEAQRGAREPYQRVHVTPYIYRNPERFTLLSVKGDVDHSGYRWTVDTPDDLSFVREVYRRLDSSAGFNWKEVIALLEREPEIARINGAVRQKELQEC